jgi:hypothetical protein
MTAPDPAELLAINKYKLVVAPSGEIADEVNKMILEGWQPFGSPAVLPAGPEDVTLHVNMVYQAMVRRGP